MVDVGFRLSLWVWAQSVLPLSHLPQCRFFLTFASLLGKRLSAFLVQPQSDRDPSVSQIIGPDLFSKPMPSSPEAEWTSSSPQVLLVPVRRKLPVSSSGEKDFFVPFPSLKGSPLRPEGLQLRLPPHPRVCLLFIRALFLSGWFEWPQESSLLLSPAGDLS